jgi:AraC-like DNA-binding protein
MKEALFKPPLSPDRVLLVKDLVEPYFDPYWHFHQEYQLFVVIRGSGTRFVGDNISSFQAGDLVLSGPNLPHLWRCEESFFLTAKPAATRGIVVYFRGDLLGSSIRQSEEGEKLGRLLELSRRGLQVVGPLRHTLQAQLMELPELSGFSQVLQLLQILHQMSESEAVQPIASLGYVPMLRPADTERLNRVQSYLFQHYRSRISLTEAAAIAHMSPSAFSRYFQQRTHKKFSQFVSELRIGHACKLLQAGQSNISEIAFASGFPTLSNFNKQFRAITGQTPSAYRQWYERVVG